MEKFAARVKAGVEAHSCHSKPHRRHFRRAINRPEKIRTFPPPLLRFFCVPGAFTRCESVCSAATAYCGGQSAVFGAPDRIRTCDLWNRNPTLYPAELRVQRSRLNRVQRLVHTPAFFPHQCLKIKDLRNLAGFPVVAMAGLVAGWWHPLSGKRGGASFDVLCFLWKTVFPFK